ncbi:MAG: hypothetical protein ACPGQS_13110 [Bradymonadia bacterium]
MEAKILLKLLEHAAFNSEAKGCFKVVEGFEVALLLATQTGSSISKVKQLRVSGDTCTVTGAESTYLLPVSHIFGLRVDGGKSGGRTGFLA